MKAAEFIAHYICDSNVEDAESCADCKTPLVIHDCKEGECAIVADVETGLLGAAQNQFLVITYKGEKDAAP